MAGKSCQHQIRRIDEHAGSPGVSGVHQSDGWVGSKIPMSEGHYANEELAAIVKTSTG